MITNIRIGYASTVLPALAAMLFSSAAHAMEIRQFDKMAIPDQGKYVGLLSPKHGCTFVERNTAASKLGRRFGLQGN